MTEWRAIPGWEGYYEAGDGGEIRSVDRVVAYSNGAARVHRGRVLKQYTHPDQLYLFVILQRQGIQNYRVHVLVLMAFAGPAPNGQQARHLNGDPKDNRPSNLAWGTRQENMQDAVVAGTICRGERHHSAKLTAEQVREIRQIQGSSQTTIARAYGVGQTMISRIRRGDKWRHVA